MIANPDLTALAELLGRIAADAGRAAALEALAADRAALAEADMLLSPRECARRVRRRLSTIFTAIRAGELPAKRLAGPTGGACAGKPRFLIRVADLRAWAAKA